MARVTVRVTPRAKQNSVEGTGVDGIVRIRVTPPPEDGKANEAVVELLAEALAVPRSRVAIVRGHRARLKAVEVEGLSAGEIASRIG